MSRPPDLLHGPLMTPAQPQQPAVVGDGMQLTYGELAAQSHRLAQTLATRNAGPGSRVAVVVPKGVAQVIAVLAVLETGAAYVPIDASTPQVRVAELLHICDPAVIISDRPIIDTTVPVVSVGEAPRAAVELTGADPDDLAYVIFTSGSTGRPKGVMIDHRAAMNTITDLNTRFGVGPEDRTFALSSLAFDLSVYDIFGALAAGGTIVAPGAADRLPSAWLRLMTEHGVTIWNSVPALMKLLVEHVVERGLLLPPSLRLVFLSGDWIPLSLPDAIRRVAPQVEVVSLGGATEASIWSILHRVRAVDPAWRSIPYGTAMTNQTVQVLDSSWGPAAPGETGEIFIGGAGLARGYWDDEQATDAAFGVNPLSGERLYRTGDLGRYLPDGAIELLGRRDHQVKIHGHRIELGEVEHAMQRHPDVTAAAARVAGDRHASRQLIGYYCVAGHAELQSHDLRTFLAGLLPSYMVPAAVVPLDALPLSANGKVDRAALPWPAG